MKRSLYCSFVLAWGALFQPAFADEGKGCLSGVCIGATIDKVPVNLKWKIDAPVNPAKMEAFYSGWGKIMGENIKAPPEVLKQLGPYRNMNGMLDTLNGKVISALQHIYGTCFGLKLTGEFQSESGYRTVVTVESYATPDGKPQQIRVSQIVRYYNSPLTDEQREKLAEQLEDEFRLPVAVSFEGRYPGEVHRKQRPITDDEPAVALSGATLSLYESATQRRSNDRQAHLQLPGCTKTPSIN